MSSRFSLLFLSILCRCFGLKSLHAQADLLVFAIEINDFCSDLLTYTQNIRGFLYMLLRDLRYMKQSVYARLQLNECTEVSHSCNTTSYNVAYFSAAVSHGF